MGLVIRKYDPNWRFTEMGNHKDLLHAHMIPSRDSMAFAVETIKKNTRCALQAWLRFLAKVYWNWQYAAQQGNDNVG